MLAKLDNYVTATRNTEAGPFGTLRVQATSEISSLILAPLSTKFVELHPGVRVHLSVIPKNHISADDGFDIIISSQKPSLPGIVAHDLGAIRHVICASPGYFRKFGRPKTPQALRDHNCLADQYSGPKSWPFRNSPRPLLVEVKGSLSSNSNAVLIRMAVDGRGIVRMPLYAIKKEIADKKLGVIFKNASLSPERLAAYSAKVKRLPAKTVDFINFMKTSLRHQING
jgi:DNA-binding transcriptional LysR family regulator